ncbi:MAG: hypothetical protein H6806_03375 [Planctomycetes bacterium]|nr:hypothetical protein [Planctomycetota bacterium]MCB9828795.1 hypothetical protein [Planctomycetota bacterium]MCB9900753.1 hypothetical protein [Planctomycetota bacterium]
MLNPFSAILRSHHGPHDLDPREQATRPNGLLDPRAVIDAARVAVIDDNVRLPNTIDEHGRSSISLVD